MLHKHTFTFTKLKILAVAFTATLFYPGVAFAQTASASGSATLTIQPNITTTETFNILGTVNGRTIQQIGGFTSSVSGEIVLPQGYLFNGAVNITPTYTNNFVSSLAISPTSIGVVAENSTFNRAAAQILINAAAGSETINTNIESVAAIIKAGAGVNGLD
jgi:phospholipase/lecithinase/hemolysin